MMAADRRLAELRRVIDQVAAEAISHETCVAASQGSDPRLGPRLGEDRHATEDS
ncbi:hypothetical protein [Caulobacter soli]|uniref:hypothetical protein n=1 Tax=Caulobacter soli TaxID=2708539 RepID=UPI0013EC13E6|nr:hypothetical protein [Caulobacter soli]